MTERSRLNVIALVVILAIMSLLPLYVGEYYLFVIRLIGINLIVALGLNIFMGYCGQISIGASAFFCIGAYCSSILQVALKWHYIPAFAGTMVITPIVAWAISFPLLRLRGHSLAIGTIAFAVSINLIVDRLPKYTGGGEGLFVPQMVLFGMKMGNMFYYYLILIFSALAFLFCHFLSNSSVGNAMRAIKEDEIAAEATGIDVHRYRMLSWVISGSFGGIAGSLYAQHSEFVAPMTFGLMSNVNFVLMIVVGGLGSNSGALLGSVVITLLSILMVSIQQYVLLVNGAVLFFILRFMPEGIAGGAVKLLRHLLSKRDVSVAN